MPKQTKEQKSFIERAKAVLNPSHKKWIKKADKKSGGVPLPHVNFKADHTHKALVNKLGKSVGCHTCLSMVHLDKNQPWVGDHCPPTELKDAAYLHYSGAASVPGRRLYPQCHECSGQQAALVRQINSCRGVYPKLSADEKKLILGNGKWSHGSVASSGPNVSTSEGLQIQALGVSHGCHTCGSKYPTKHYIADHFPPVQFQTHYMLEICEKLGVKLPSARVLPQCVRCSTNQGGTMSALTRVSKKVADQLKITRYNV